MYVWTPRPMFRRRAELVRVNPANLNVGGRSVTYNVCSNVARYLSAELHWPRLLMNRASRRAMS